MTFKREELNRLTKQALVDMLLKRDTSEKKTSSEEGVFEVYTREIVDLSPDALLIFRPDEMQLVACNLAALQLLELDSRDHMENYLLKLFRERPLFYDLLKELGSTFSQQSKVSMEVEFDTYEKHQRFGDLVVRKVEVMGRPLLMLRIIDITELKQVQMQALDSERQLEMAQEIAQIGSYIYYEDEKRFQFSKAFFSLLDLGANAAKPLSMCDLMNYIVEEDRPRMVEAIEQLYSRKKDISLQFRIISHEGATKHLFCKVKVELGRLGQMSKLVGTIQDISERVMTEQRLKESEERFRLTVENTNDGVWYWNFRTLEGYMSPKFEPTLGFEDEVIDEQSVNKWFMKVHPEERQAYRDTYEACIRGFTDSFMMEFRYQALNGAYIWVESGAALFRDENNDPHYLLGTIRDIQDRKEAEFQLREKERFLSMAQGVAKIGSWIWDRETDSLQYSDELYHIMELSGQIDGKKLGDEVISLVVDEDKERVDCFISEARNLNDHEQHFLEARIHVASGNIKVLRTLGQVYQRNALGEVTKLIGTTQDITQDKLREQELVAAKEQAEVSQRAKDRFLQIVSHEIRNPLNAILGITRLLEQSKLAQTQQEQVATLGFSSRHLLSIISDILDTAKLQYGNIKLDRVPFSLASQLHQIEELFRPLAADQQTQLLFTLDDKLPKLVMGDPTRFNQIIFNLLSNAVKYTYRGTINLEARLLKEKHDSALLQFEVSDTGTGIPSEKLDKVFEAFEQFDLPQSQQKGGTGLGLYIVHQLLSLMDGNIEVQSNFGEGTVFTITLAFDQARDEPYHAAVSTQHLADFSECRILYVEDAHYNQLLLKGYAQGWNLKLDVASDIGEALRMIKNQAYDLILTDYSLPDGTGSDVAKGLEALKLREKIPLIVISAYQIEEDLEQFDFDDYLQKPINFDKFFYILRKYLAKNISGSGQELPGPEDGDVNVLQYLEENQPAQYHKVIDNLVEELPDFQAKVMQSIETHNYRLYLLTVHKLSSALKMIQQQKLLDYLQNMEDLPTTAEGKLRVKKQVKSYFLEVKENCKAINLSGKKH